MGEYNPDRPYVMGMQWAPLVADTVLLDTGSEVGYTFRAQASHAAGTGLRRVRLHVASPPPGLPNRKEMLVNLYPAGQVAGTGPVRKLTIPVRDGALVTGAALAGGSATPPDAVSNPSDPRHITLTGPNAAARFWFDTNSSLTHAKLDGRRILDVSVLYVISGPFADLAPAVTLGLERPSAGVNWLMDETLNGPAVHNGVTAVGRSRLGELNPWWNTAAAPTTEKGRVPWRARNLVSTGNPPAGLSALSASGGTNINVRLQVAANAAATAVFQVHYLALEVSYGEENRVGGGGLNLSEGASYIGGYYYEVPIWDAVNFSGTVDLTAGREYAVTVGQAYAGQLSVASPVPVKADRLGPVEPYPAHRGVLLRKTLRAGQTPTLETVDELPSVVLFTGISAPGNPDLSSHSYVTQAVATVSELTPAGWTMQQLVEDVAADWVWARFYARHLPGTRAPLELAQVSELDTTRRLGPVARVTVEEFDALPEIADGWREVTVRLDTPYLSDGVGETTYWTFTSSAGGQSPWQVLGVDANPWSTQPAGWEADPGYGGRTAWAVVDGQSDESADLTLMFAQEMDAVLGLDVEPAVQPLTVVDDQCDWPASRIPTGIRYHRLSWLAVNSSVVAGWSCYEVQRQDDTMAADEWETIAKVVEPSVTAVDDYEARVGVESRYRIRMVHRLGIAGPWSPPVAATIAAPGVEGRNVDTGVLILTSNHNPAANLAYVENFDRSSVEDFTFPEAEQVELQEMFDRDFRTAFRPLERGGVEFTRTVLVNQAAVPPATMDRGFTDLRDLAWDTVPYVCVRDELRNRWLSTLLVPSASVKRRKAGQLQLAQVQVVEVTATPAPLDGGPAACEGLRPEGQVPAVTAGTPVPAAGLAPGVFEDLFNRNVSGGLGNGWTIAEGAAVDYSVAAEAATINLAGGGSRTAVVGAGWEDVDVQARFQFSAVATGQPINAYLVGRYQALGTHYRARLAAQTDGKLGVAIERVVNGVLGNVTALATVRATNGVDLLGYQAGPWYWMRLQVRDGAVRVAVWPDGQRMARWEQSAKDTTIAGAGQIGVRGVLTAGNTNAAPTVKVAELTVWQPATNDLDVRVELRPTGDEWTAELSRTDDNGGTTGWKLTADPVQTCLNLWGGAGFTACHGLAPSTRALVVTRQRRWLRVTYRNDVFGQGTADYWSSEDGLNWTQESMVQAPPEPPTVDPGQLALVLTGDVTVARAEVRQGVDGPVLAAPDFESQAAGTTRFADAQGNTWEVDGRGICAPA
ncbi:MULTISPECIES: hypothetical protein [Micromonospora]|uniref:Minor tail protein n=1 Tax=Micromonospora solifontis TaxID=2487138 RepID=A0ABX9WKX1_9ACTN|nr:MULTISPECIES: hypothetical protein [Micromonospora]NES14548.1 hypothetical protein [Micromonospora sp. PPF5-17B]NES35314.1 hypothetical protein [Micromonospora solifontis]RNM01039.1 hypothetical protein EFE23_03945 [Micromonospora solifontis]